MAVHIRLKRGGQIRQPHYRIVVSDSRVARDGKFIEVIGFYNPIAKVEEVELNKDRFTYWLSVGAQPTDTIKSLLTKKGMWAGLCASAQAMAKSGTPAVQAAPKVKAAVAPVEIPVPAEPEIEVEEPLTEEEQEEQEEQKDQES